MRRKKEITKSEISDLLYTNQKISIYRTKEQWFFEIGREITTDLGEAVAILMKNKEVNEEIWNIEIKECDSELISPARSLFYLTGGYNEWATLENYSKPWNECCLEFQEEFGFMITKIIKRSKKLSDVKNGFTKYLNLPVLYDYAISKNLLK